ncbi:hypothetical protein BSM4216_1134 [Bacillus smithii]|nr:hypothetical protein BSM4216_1134 [Bacillus smithii]
MYAFSFSYSFYVFRVLLTNSPFLPIQTYLQNLLISQIKKIHPAANHRMIDSLFFAASQISHS